MVTLNILYTDEAVKELNGVMNSKEFYIAPDGSLVFSVSTDPLELVVKHLANP